MIWFTSDTHFGHAKIIEYCNRPFNSSIEMNEHLIARWNGVVAPDDTVIHLGDFGLGRAATLQAIFEQLNGEKILVRGNHDKQDVLKLGWREVVPYMEMKIDGHFVVLSHYAFRVWNKSHRGSINLYGHSHNGLPDNSQQLDVGVDCWNFTPVSFTQILERLATLPPYRQPDKHSVAYNS